MTQFEGDITTTDMKIKLAVELDVAGNGAEKRTLTPYEFYTKVTKWGADRGMYEESTAVHQAAKALEELGEYLVTVDAEHIDVDMLRDDIGDMQVCLVHCINFMNEYNTLGILLIEEHWADMCNTDRYNDAPMNIEAVGRLIIVGRYVTAFSALCRLAEYHGLDIGECHAQSYGDIQHRNGMFIDKKYVKWDNLNPTQRRELCERLGIEYSGEEP